ncbi:RBP11-like subunits of RNA polymerase [Clavulina sp. PMI_390]|nr:RBP11-like subunits of RNA polymerase [Clavulina sp. PMI_390]
MAHSLDDPNRQVRYHAEYVSNVSSQDYPGVDPDNDHLWNLEEFKQRLTVAVTSLSEVAIEFDLVGVDASIANAFRRALIAEVPTMAIEHVYIYDNTGVVQDEVLAQRLGLIPLQVEAEDFDYVDTSVPIDDQLNDRNALVFSLEIACERVKKPPPGAVSPDDLYINSNVYSKHLQWKPEGNQGRNPKYKSKPPKPALEHILLAKLRPGQRILATLHAIKGRGEIHAKWSPVATASYRLLPRINIRGPIPPEHQQLFQQCFPEGVIGRRKNPNTGEQEVYVKDARKDTVSREVLRHDEFDGLVDLTRVRDFFLFRVETSGVTAPENLFPQAVKVLRSKIQKLKEDIRTHVLPKLEAGDGDVVMAEG